MRPDEDFAFELDAADPLAPFRDRFDLPASGGGEPRIYLLGNSLGPLPVAARDAVNAELDAWADRGVESYFESPANWAQLDTRHRESMATIAGCTPDEVAFMNGLSVNLHLLLASFYRPSGGRTRVLVGNDCFPSDRYVVETHLRWHGVDPGAGLVETGVADGRTRTEAVLDTLRVRGSEIAMILLEGVDYATGELLDIERVAAAGRETGCVVGLDLAHAVGNVPLSLHDWGVDCAAWCTYKYLNCGPGAPAALFVHERHSVAGAPPRLGGWWGTDPEARFGWMDRKEFAARPGAVGWQLSCPPVLSLAPLGPSLDLFAEAGMGRIRAKSVQLTGYLEYLLARLAGGRLDLLTPADREARGAQLSLRVRDARAIQEALSADGVDTDVREPDILRCAPAPLFNTYHEVWRAAHLIANHLEGNGGDD
jgi:kynureninase